MPKDAGNSVVGVFDDGDISVSVNLERGFVYLDQDDDAVEITFDQMNKIMEAINAADS